MTPQEKDVVEVGVCLIVVACLFIFCCWYSQYDASIASCFSIPAMGRCMTFGNPMFWKICTYGVFFCMKAVLIGFFILMSFVFVVYVGIWVMDRKKNKK